MGTIPGPIISFRWQTGDASSAIGQVATQVKKQLGDAGAASAKATVSAWQAAAAQLRAAIATESAGTKEIVTARTRIIALAKEDLAIHAQKAALTKSQLSNLRAATLEIERQKNALQGRGALTSATQQFIDAFKLRVGGVGGPIAARAYEPIGKFVTGGVNSFEEAVGPAAIAIGGVTAAIAAVGVAAALTTKHMMNLAQSIQNTAAATGLSSKQVQVYGELAKEMDIDQGSLEMAFARIQTQLGESLTTGKAGGTGSQFFVKVMNQLGVPLKNGQGNLRDVSDIISDFSDKLQKIPDQATRTALTMEALGTRGRVLAQVMQEAASEGKSLGQVLREIGESGIVIPDAQLNNLMQAKARWDELKRSIEAAKITVEGFVAAAFLNPGAARKSVGSGILGYITGGFGGAVAAASGTFVSATSGAAQSLGIGGGLSPAILSATSANEELAQRLQVLKAGGEIQLQLLQAEAGYASAVNSHNQALVELYAKQISMLKQIIELEKNRPNQMFNRIISPGGRYGTQGIRPNLANRKYGPNSMYGMGPFAAPAVPDLGVANSSLPSGDIFALLGIPDPALTSQGIQAMEKLHDEWLNITSDAVTKIQIQYQKELDNFNTLLVEKKISAQQFSQAQVELAQIEASKVDEIHKQEMEKYKSEAGQLFDSLISGQKNFGQMFVRILEGAVLAPVKQVFEKVIAQMLQDLDKAISGKGGKGGKGIGGVLGKILGALGIGQNATLAVAQQNVQAQTVIITSAGGIVGTGGGIGNNMFGGGMNFAGGGMGSIGSILGSVLPGAILLGAGLHDSNPVAIAMGIAMTGGAALSSISKLLGPRSQLGSVLGQIGGVLPGIGMIAASTQMGGLGGFLTGAGGGAMSGMQIGGIFGGPVGAGIGAAIGAIVGGIASLFGGGSAARHAAESQRRIARYMRNEQLIMPPSETFAFSAMDSMAQTLGTTFSEGPGGTFGNVALPANTPFWANAILGFPKTGGQLTALQKALAGINTGLPFFGDGQTPFTGLPLPPGTQPFNANAATVIHIQVDGKTIATAVSRHLPTSVGHSSSGFRQAAFAANEMP